MSVKFHCPNVEVNLVTLSFEDIPGYKTVVSVYVNEHCSEGWMTDRDF